jgi:glycosyltransferase involved in cell wall biosynthesis
VTSSSTMNILILTAMFPPIRTGTSFYSRNLAEALRLRGHQVVVVSLENSEAATDPFPFDVHRLRAFHAPLKFFKHFRLCSVFPGNYKKGKQIGQSFRPDVILLVNHYLDIAFLAVYLSRVLKVPLFCSVGTQLQSTNPLHHKLINALDRLICGRIVFRACQNIISWDGQIHRYLEDVHNSAVVEKSVVIPYGINGKTEDFLKYEHDYRLKNQIIGVGAVIKQRNFLFLIRVFKELANEFPSLTVKIIGHVYYPAPVRLAKELGVDHRIVFAGELSHAEVVEEVKRSDLYWGPGTGKYTGLGTATIENMLLGIPIVTNIPPDLFGEPRLFDSQHFVYTDLADLQRTSDRVRQLLTSEALRRKIGQGGRQFVKDHLSWGRIAGMMEELFTRHTSPKNGLRQVTRG